MKLLRTGIIKSHYEDLQLEYEISKLKQDGTHKPSLNSYDQNINVNNKKGINELT